MGLIIVVIIDVFQQCEWHGASQNASRAEVRTHINIYGTAVSEGCVLMVVATHLVGLPLHAPPLGAW